MNPSDPDLYLVRVWRGGRRFRATARRVDEDTPHSLHSLEELAAYFADGPLAVPSPAPGAGQGGKRPGNAPAGEFAPSTDTRHPPAPTTPRRKP